MSLGAPIDPEATLRELMEVLVNKGVLNLLDMDTIIQVGERTHALAPEKQKPEGTV